MLLELGFEGTMDNSFFDQHQPTDSIKGSWLTIPDEKRALHTPGAECNTLQQPSTLDTISDLLLSPDGKHL